MAEVDRCVRNAVGGTLTVRLLFRSRSFLRSQLSNILNSARKYILLSICHASPSARFMTERRLLRSPPRPPVSLRRSPDIHSSEIKILTRRYGVDDTRRIPSESVCFSVQDNAPKKTINYAKSQRLSNHCLNLQSNCGVIGVQPSTLFLPGEDQSRIKNRSNDMRSPAYLVTTIYDSEAKVCSAQFGTKWTETKLQGMEKTPHFLPALSMITANVCTVAGAQRA